MLFNKLLRVPLTSAAEKLTGPIIIVLDALDECGDQGTREALLEILATKLSRLPTIFRFLITSRPEEDIKSRFADSNLVMSLESMVEGDAVSDVQAYIESQLGAIRAKKNLPMNWPPANQVSLLVENSEGLFIWASTMCKLIDTTPMHNVDAILSVHRAGACKVSIRCMQPHWRIHTLGEVAISTYGNLSDLSWQ